MRKLILMAALLGLAACADTVGVFPLNEEAKDMGPVTANITRTGFGFAPVTVTLSDGEVLHGTARPAFRETFSEGFGAAGGHVGAVSGVGMSGGTLQIVLSGPKTQLLCYGTVNLSGHRNGECRTFDGARWAINY